MKKLKYILRRIRLGCNGVLEVSKRRVSKEPKRKAVTVVLPEDLLGALDGIADEVGDTRSGVIETLLTFGLVKENLDQIYPFEETGEEEEDDEEEGEEPEGT